MNLDIYPNPADQELKIKSEIEFDELRLISISGNTKVIEKNKSNVELHVGEIDQGVYILRVTYNSYSIVRRVIIIH